MESITNYQQNATNPASRAFQALEEIFGKQLPGLSGDKGWYYLYVSSPETFFFIILKDPLPFTHGADKTSQVAPINIYSGPLKVSEELDREFQRDPSFLITFQGEWENFDPQQPNHSLLDLLQGGTTSIRYKTFTLHKPASIWDEGEEGLKGFKAQDQHGLSFWSHASRVQATECAKEEVKGKRARIERDQQSFIKLRDEKGEQWKDKKQWQASEGKDEEVGTSLERLYKSSERHLKFWTFVQEQIKKNPPVSIDEATINSFRMGTTNGVRQKIEKYRNPTSSTNITLQIKKVTKITRSEKDYLQIENLKDELHYWNYQFEKEINQLKDLILDDQLKESKKLIKSQESLRLFDGYTARSEKLRVLREAVNYGQINAILKESPQKDFKAEIEGFQALCKRLKETIEITDYQVYKKIEAFQEMNKTLSTQEDAKLLKRFSTTGHILIGRANREKKDTEQLDEVHIKIKQG